MERYIQTLQDFMVMVRCYTYNHSAYITDALNGFTMQQTNFPFVIVLVDDASTDGEQEIIQEYITSLDVLNDEDKKNLLKLAPIDYIGLAPNIVNNTIVE